MYDHFYTAEYLMKMNEQQVQKRLGRHGNGPRKNQKWAGISSWTLSVKRRQFLAALHPFRLAAKVLLTIEIESKPILRSVIHVKVNE